MVPKRNSATALARVAVGSVFLLGGLGKVLGAGLPGTGGGASWLLSGLEVALGGMLLAGVIGARALVPTGALLVGLTFATVLGANASLGALEILLLVGAAALLWLESATGWARLRVRVREELGVPPVRLQPMPPIPRNPSRRWTSRRTPRDRV